jgi:hypothetical protein
MRCFNIFLFLLIACAARAQQPNRLFERTFDFENGNLQSSTPEQCSVPEVINPYTFNLGMKTIVEHDGKFYQVFSDAIMGNEFLRVFIRQSDDGINWSSPVAITPEASFSRHDATINIVQKESATLIVVQWVKTENNTPGFEMAYSTDGLANFSDPTSVANANGYLYINSNVVADSDGVFYAIWCVYNGSWQNMYFSKSTDMGLTWSDAEIIYTGNQYSSQPVAIVREAGEVIFTLLDDQFFHTNSKVVFTEDAGENWSTGNMTNYASGQGNTHWTTITVAPNGDLYGLSFYYNTFGTEDSQEIQCARSTDFGATWTANTEVSDQLFIMNGWDNNNNTVIGATVSENGNVYVVWSDSRLDFPNDSNFDTYLSYSTDDGVTWSTDILVNENTEAVFQSFAAVAAKSEGGNDHVVVTWMDNRCFTPAIIQIGNTMDCHIPNATYQWYLNGVAISGSNSMAYEGTVSGIYTVDVFDGFCDTTSNSFNFTYIGIEEERKNDIQISPNPADDFISISSPTKIEHIDILNAAGQIVMQENANQVFLKRIDISPLPCGIYVLQSISSHGKYCKILLKK